MVPLCKPGKDCTDLRNYGPIALTSYICKIMEKMINERLIFFVKQISIYLSFRVDSGNAGIQWMQHYALNMN